MKRMICRLFGFRSPSRLATHDAGDPGKPDFGLLGWNSRLATALLLLLAAAPTLHAATTTTIQDVVYRANGLPAQGTLVISWPAFTAAGNLAVAAGSMSVAIGPQGAFTVALVPNAGGTPADTYYTVVYKLDELKAHMRWLVGNGNQGRVQQLEQRIDRHERILQRAIGIGALAGALLTLLHLGIDFLRLHAH